MSIRSRSVNDYPAMIVQVNHVEPVPRRVRAFLADETVFDTTRALYVWEWPNYPQYYIPLADVRPGLLIPEGHTQHSRRGEVDLHGLQVGDTHRPRAAKVLHDSPVGGLSGTVRFEWAAMDAWLEEDERVFVHPRNPYVRVDALRSTRTVRVELDGTVLAESSSPIMVFETGLPTRYYLNRTEIQLRASDPHRHGHRVPVQGHYQRLLVYPGRRQRSPRPRVVLRLPHPPAAAYRRPRRVLQRKSGHLPRWPAARAPEDPLLPIH